MPARSVISQSKQSAVGVRLSVICWDYGQRHSSVLPCPFEKAQRRHCLLAGSAPDQQSRGQVGKSRAPKGLKQRAGAALVAAKAQRSSIQAGRQSYWLPVVSKPAICEGVVRGYLAWEARQR